MEIFELTLLTALLVFSAALIAGFVDSLVGGGGFITIPTLLMVGLLPHHALGTNKLQAFVGTGSATWVMFKKSKLQWQNVKGLMLMAFIGSLIGTFVLQYVNAGVLVYIIPVVLVLVAAYFLFSPEIADSVSKPKISDGYYQNGITPTVGFYDGLFGPGTGSFFTLAGTSLKGLDLVSASAQARALNFSTNVASLLVFLFYAKIAWSIGLVMMVGQCIGANLGARYLLKINPNFLRYALVLASLIMLIIWTVKELA